MTDKPIPTTDLLKRCAEIHEWRSTGVLSGEALRDYAKRKWPDLHDTLQMAEHETVTEALALLAKWGQPAQAAEPVAWWIPKAEQFALADKSGDRPFAKAWEPLYAVPQPVARVPLSAAQKQHIHNETGAGHALICLVERYLLDAHGIKGDQHGTE